MELLTDLFNETLLPGDSFLRIENKMGGSTLRYYFLAEYTSDDRILVKEYGSVPRVINRPCKYKNSLLKLTPQQMVQKNIIAPKLEDVVLPSSVKKKAKPKSGEVQQL